MIGNDEARVRALEEKVADLHKRLQKLEEKLEEEGR